MKLKTFKEFDLTCEDRCPDKCWYANLLRKEAIKWIKEINNFYRYIGMIKADNMNLTDEEKNKMKLYFGEGYTIEDRFEKKLPSIINFIKYFFNITEEDLDTLTEEDMEESIRVDNTIWN